MSKNMSVYNLIRHIVGEFGASDALADDLCSQIGDTIEGAVIDRFHEQFANDDPPPRRLGMTECEASLRWCPMAREVVSLGKKDAGIGNRYLDERGADYANPAGARCIGSYCTAWRWHDATRGYCGLAGRPTYQPIGEPRRLANRTPLERPTASEQRDLFDA